MNRKIKLSFSLTLFLALCSWGFTSLAANPMLENYPRVNANDIFTNHPSAAEIVSVPLKVKWIEKLLNDPAPWSCFGKKVFNASALASEFFTSLDGPSRRQYAEIHRVAAQVALQAAANSPGALAEVVRRFRYTRPGDLAVLRLLKVLRDEGALAAARLFFSGWKKDREMFFVADRCASISVHTYIIGLSLQLSSDDRNWALNQLSACDSWIDWAGERLSFDEFVQKLQSSPVSEEQDWEGWHSWVPESELAIQEHRANLLRHAVTYSNAYPEFMSRLIADKGRELEDVSFCTLYDLHLESLDYTKLSSRDRTTLLALFPRKLILLALEDFDSQIRQRAMTLLAEKGEFEILKARLVRDSYWVRDETIETFARFKEEGAKALSEVVTSSELPTETRASAAYRLVFMGPEARVAWPALIHAAQNDPIEEVRSWSVFSLKNMQAWQSTAGFLALLNALEDEAFSPRLTAIQAMKEMALKSAEGALGTHSEAITEQVRAVLPRLRALSVKDPDPRLRSSAAYAVSVIESVLEKAGR